MMRRQTISVSNLAHESAAVYKRLQSFDWCEYSEGSADENARKLLEGSVDIALIPASEFALHGAYCGLGFGIGCSVQSNRLFLSSRGAIHKVQTIYVQAHCVSAATLLRIVLADYWDCTPRLVRITHDIDPENLKQGEALLELSDRNAVRKQCEGVFVEDLMHVWHKLTGLPLVFCIWAARSERLTEADTALLRESFAGCLPAAGSDKSPHAEATEPVDLYYALDCSILGGLQHFFDRAGARGFLPHARYCDHTEGTQHIGHGPHGTPKTTDSMLQDVLDGQRLSIDDGVRLASRAALADLGLAADVLRSRLYGSFPARFYHTVKLKGRERQESVLQQLRKAEQLGVSYLVLNQEDAEPLTLAEYEAQLRWLRLHTQLTIEGFSVTSIRAVSEREERSVEEVVSALVTAGLDVVSARGGELLVNAVMTPAVSYPAAEWLRVMSWVHRDGARSVCCFNPLLMRTWEDCFIHLHKIRSLQDLTNGFWQFYCVAQNQSGSLQPDLDLWLRSIALCRLFLDNVPGMYAYNPPFDSCIGISSLSFGSNAVLAERCVDEQACLPAPLQVFNELEAWGFAVGK